MNRTLKIVLIAIGVLIVVLIALPFLIPVNQFKPTIEEKASAALGRKVQIGGLSLRLLRGALGISDVSIADDPKFSSSPFLTAKSLSVGVEIMPLIFSKQLNVTGITIEEPQVNLLRNQAGQWNYSTIGTSSSAPANAPATGAPQAPASGGSGGGGTGISIARLELTDGKITVGSISTKRSSVYDHVNVTASNVSTTSKFPVTISANLPGGGDFKLDGDVGPLDKNNAELTPLNTTDQVSNLNLATTGFLDPSLGLGGVVDMNGTITSQGGQAATKGSLKLSKALLVQGGSPAGIPATIDYSTKYDLQKNSGVINPSTVKIGSAAAHLAGTYSTQGDATVVDMKLNGDGMPAKDLQAFLPAIGVNLPQGATLSTGTLSTNLNIKGPTDKLVTDGTIGLFNGTLAGFDLGSKMSSISSLAGLKTGKDLVIEKMTSNVHIAPNGLRADNFDAVVQSLGELTGGGTLDSKNNLDFKMVAKLSAGVVGAMGTVGGQQVGGVLNAALGGGGQACKGGGMTVPFQIQGTSSNPRFIPDVGGVAAGMLKSELGCAGGAVTNPTNLQNLSKNPADTINSLGGLLGKKKKP